MSVRVNLLPGEVADKNRAARQRAAVGAGALGLVGVLGLVYVFQLNRVSDARAQLEAEQAEAARLNGEVAKLQEFGDLELRLETNQQVLAAALGDEASFAGILQDLAAVMPTDAELDSISITLLDNVGAPLELGALRPSLGTMSLAGRTMRGHAPGVERLLLELNKVAAFSNVFFSTSTLDQEGVSSFAIDVDLGDEILTERYANGVPEELR